MWCCDLEENKHFKERHAAIYKAQAAQIANPEMKSPRRGGAPFWNIKSWTFSTHLWVSGRRMHLGGFLWLGFSPHSGFLRECTFERGYMWTSRLTFNNAFYLMPYLVRSFPENYSCDALFSKPWEKENQANYGETLKELEWNVIEYAFWAVHSTLKGPAIRELTVNPHTRAVCKWGWATVSEDGSSARPCGRESSSTLRSPPGPPCTSLLLLPH